MVEQHLESWSDRLPESVSEILRSLYVHDLISGGPTVPKAKELKDDAITIFADSGFQLHKWHSNAPEVERDSQEQPAETEDTYAKHQLGFTAVEGTKLLGLGWDKAEECLVS